VIEPQPDQITPTREDVEHLLAFGREACPRAGCGKSPCPIR
jgi:hypothetical protein